MNTIKLPALTWENAPEILTVAEAAELLRINRKSAYEAVRHGQLPAVNLGQRQIRISKSKLQQVFGTPKKQTPTTAALNHGEA